MKKKMAIYGLILAIISASLIPVVNASTNEGKSEILTEKQTTIEKKLTLENLPALTDSLKQATDQKVIKVLEFIVNTIEEQGEICEGQIEGYLESEEIECQGFGLYKQISAVSNGVAWAIPGFVRGSLFVYWNKGFLLLWDASNDDCYPGKERIDVVVDGEEYHNEHSGFAIGHHGPVSCKLMTYNVYKWPYFVFGGKALFVMIF